MGHRKGPGEKYGNGNGNGNRWEIVLKGIRPQITNPSGPLWLGLLNLAPVQNQRPPNAPFNCNYDLAAHGTEIAQQSDEEAQEKPQQFRGDWWKFRMVISIKNFHPPHFDAEGGGVHRWLMRLPWEFKEVPNADAL